MPDFRSGWFLGLACAALTVSGCDENARLGPEPTPDDPEFTNVLEDARQLVNEGKLSQAAGLYDEALEADPRNSELWTDVARLRFRGGEHLAALKAADYALSLDPSNASALLFRAQLVRDSHGLGEALPWFEAALAQHTEHEDILAEYAATLGDLGRHKDMLAAVRRLAEINPRNPRVHYLQAVLAARAGDPVTASSLLKRSGLLDAGVPSAMMLGALIEIQQGNYDNAAANLEQLLERQSANVRVAELLARAMWLKGRDEEIVSHFLALADEPAASPYLVMLVGRSLERLGRREDAAGYISRARSMEEGKLMLLYAPKRKPRGLPEPTFSIRRLLNERRNDEAARLAASIKDRFPNSSDIMALAGDVDLARGDDARALLHYSEAARVRRPWPLTKKIIHAYRRTDDKDAAEALLVRHLRTEPRNTEALIMLARQSAENEDWLRAKVLLDTAISLGAGSDLELLALRREAAIALDEADTAKRIAQDIAVLKPPKFVND